jgi:hypothetical protein
LKNSFEYLLNESQLEKNIEWLLAKSSPSVVYLTNLNLLKRRQYSEEMQELWNKVQQSPGSKEIFGKQREDGSWYDGGSWSYRPTYMPKSGYTPVSPKYVTTAWLLTKLGEMGYTVKEPKLRKACEWLLEWQWQNGVLSEKKNTSQSLKVNPYPSNIPCRMSIQLEALAKVGFGTDPRLRKSWDLMLRWRREDNGWVQDGHLDGTASPYKIWTRSCPYVSYFATSAFIYSRIPEYRKYAKESLRFILWHMDQKEVKDLQRFFFHGHEPLKELLMFSEIGFDHEHESIKGLLNWLKGMYDPCEACFRYKGKPYSKMNIKEDGATSRVMKYRMYHQVEDDWLTYYSTMIFKNFLN